MTPHGRTNVLRSGPLSAWLPAALAALLMVGCALTSKSTPIAPRYFSPELADGSARTGTRANAAPLELRLGRVNGASYLDERIVYRDSAFELGYYQERRWTETPAEYLKRRLARVLFEWRMIHRVVGGAAPTLEVDLVAFEEIRAPKRLARIQAVVRLQDQHAVRWEEMLTVEQPFVVTPAGDPASPMVEALGLALGKLVDRIADRVVNELSLPLSLVPR